MHLEHRDRQLNTSNKQALRELWTNSGSDKLAENFSAFANAPFAENEDVLHGDNLALHACDLSHAYQFARAVAHTADLDDKVYRRGDLPANRTLLQVQVS